MKLTKELKSNLINEFRFAAKSMRGVQIPNEKLYFFSIVYTSASRIMNIEFDPELGFLHHVAAAAYSNMYNALNLINSKQMIYTISPNLFSRLEEQIDLLVDALESEKPIYTILQEIANLAYSMTGNGHYLSLKGAIKV